MESFLVTVATLALLLAGANSAQAADVQVNCSTNMPFFTNGPDALDQLIELIGGQLSHRDLQTLPVSLNSEVGLLTINGQTTKVRFGEVTTSSTSYDGYEFNFGPIVASMALEKYPSEFSSDKLKWSAYPLLAKRKQGFFAPEEKVGALFEMVGKSGTHYFGIGFVGSINPQLCD